MTGPSGLYQGMLNTTFVLLHPGSVERHSKDQPSEPGHLYAQLWGNVRERRFSACSKEMGQSLRWEEQSCLHTMCLA